MQGIGVGTSGFICIINYGGISSAGALPPNAFLLMSGQPFLLMNGGDFLLME